METRPGDVSAIVVEWPLVKIAFLISDFFRISEFDFRISPSFHWQFIQQFSTSLMDYFLIFGRHAFSICRRKRVARECTAEGVSSDALDHSGGFLWFTRLAAVGVQKLSFTPG